MEVLFKGHWHHGYVKRPEDFERRDVDPEENAIDGGVRVTIPQATLFILWLVSCVLLAGSFIFRRQRPATVIIVDAEAGNQGDHGEKDGQEDLDDHDDGMGNSEGKRGFYRNSSETNGSAACREETEGKDIIKEKNKDGYTAESPQVNDTSNKSNSSNFSTVKSRPTFEKFLLYAMGLGVILLYFFFCEVWDEWPVGERVYNRDQFMFFTLIMFLVAGVFTVRTCPDKLLNRDQTEEWKGWMQVMFVWYHYFKAAETYNLVRVYIACYVWMTGFGNFSFFWVRKDFTLWRMMKMLFRLNFLVILVVMVTNNSYMLYYICAMHTYWFLSVYLFMFVFRSWNENPRWMAIKFAAYFICNALVFDTPLLVYIFRPLWFILSYGGSLHEWQFRAGLDHYACFVGMLCAYNYPHYERWMNYLDKKHIDKRDKRLSILIKGFIIAILLVLTVIWYRTFMLKDKYAYNQIHPYISWFPIITYIFLRNMFPALRTRYLYFFTFLGKITLETYISQLHIYLQSNAKDLIAYIPGYPLMNFALATAIYLFISYWLFEITTVFSSYLFPQDMKTVGIHFGVGFVVCGLAACLALILKEAAVF
nr:uncharacterized protein LOC129260400 [Lytechinus pictus]